MVTRQQGRLPQLIGVKRREWRGRGELHSDGEFQRARQAALERDRYTCRSCGWSAKKWLEVHHTNDDHNDNREENLATTCAWCHGIHHVGLLGTQDLGMLALHPEHPRKQLPEQWRLNHLFRAILAMDRVRAGEVEMQEQQNRLIDFLEGDCVDSAGYWLETTDPSELGDYLLGLTETAYAKRGQWLAPFRIVPRFLLPEDLARLPPAWQREQARRAYETQELLRRLGEDWSIYRGRKAA